MIEYTAVPDIMKYRY